jgi:hypothetical protein
MDQKLKELIEKETGVKIDGKVTTEELKAVYDYLKPVVEMVFPKLPEYEDELIDKVEARAMLRSGFRKKAALTACAMVRSFLKCPDDDDNITQK